MANDLTPKELGRQGEFRAMAFLKRLGYRIVACNVTLPIGRTRRGNPLTVELDIVAFDGDRLVFVEVKTRISEDRASPLAAVTPHKQAYLRRGAERYRRLIGPFDTPFRFDVVGIVWPPDAEPKITHVKDFFR